MFKSLISNLSCTSSNEACIVGFEQTYLPAIEAGQLLIDCIKNIFGEDRIKILVQDLKESAARRIACSSNEVQSESYTSAEWYTVTFVNAQNAMAKFDLRTAKMLETGISENFNELAQQRIGSNPSIEQIENEFGTFSPIVVVGPIMHSIRSSDVCSDTELKKLWDVLVKINTSNPSQAADIVAKEAVKREKL